MRKTKLTAHTTELTIISRLNAVVSSNILGNVKTIVIFGSLWKNVERYKLWGFGLPTMKSLD